MWNAEMLGVEDAPSDCSLWSAHITSVLPFSPWRLQRVIFSGQCSQKAAEGVVLGVKDAGDVFPDAKSGRSSVARALFVDGIEDVDIGEGEVAAFIGEGVAEAGDGKGLARGSAGEDVGVGEDLLGPLLPFGHVAEVGDMRPMVGEDGGGKGLDL